MQDPDYSQDYGTLEPDGEFEPEELEAYCVNCKQKVVMENPVPVWTRRGAPGTRGVCEICGMTVFRMGRTDAHRHLERPDMDHMLGGPKPTRKSRRSEKRLAVYVNYCLHDGEVAERLAEDLSRAGVPAWFDPTAEPDRVSWAGGVHPALDECSHMVVVLSNSALETDAVGESWKFFRKQRKPILVAQVAPCEVPDELRSRPRFDFQSDYKTTFRALVQALAG